MKLKMKKCKSCGEYTLTDKCPCGGEVGVIYPPKYSPEDKYVNIDVCLKSSS